MIQICSFCAAELLNSETFTRFHGEKKEIFCENCTNNLPGFFKKIENEGRKLSKPNRKTKFLT